MHCLAYSSNTDHEWYELARRSNAVDPIHRIIYQGQFDGYDAPHHHADGHEKEEGLHYFGPSNAVLIFDLPLDSFRQRRIAQMAL